MDEFLRLLETVLRTFEVTQSPQAFMVLVGLAFARLLAFLVIAPFFGGAAVPSRVKVATATGFVIIVYPALAAGLVTTRLVFCRDDGGSHCDRRPTGCARNGRPVVDGFVLWAYQPRCTADKRLLFGTSDKNGNGCAGRAGFNAAVHESIHTLLQRFLQGVRVCD